MFCFDMSAAAGLEELDQAFLRSCSPWSLVVVSGKKNFRRFCWCSCCSRVSSTANSGCSCSSVYCHRSFCIHSDCQTSDFEKTVPLMMFTTSSTFMSLSTFTASTSSAKLTCFLRSLWTISSLALTSSNWSFPRVVAEIFLLISVFFVLLRDAKFSMSLTASYGFLMLNFPSLSVSRAIWYASVIPLKLP